MKMATIMKGRLGFFLPSFTNALVNRASSFRRSQNNLLHCSSLFYVKGQELKMPSLSPTMTEGKIVKWLKKEGDTINPGDVLCDIETDKAIVSMEVEEEGVLAKILVTENTSKVKVNSLIGLMVSKGEDWKNVEIPSEVVSVSKSSFSSVLPPCASPELRNGPPVFPVKMPSLSPTMTAGTIVKWLKKEGDTVISGDILCDIQTDKAIISMEAEEDGILAKILVPDDSKDIAVGTLIAVIVSEGEDWKNVSVPLLEPSLGKRDVQSQISSSGTPGTNGVRGKSFGPAVKVLLASYQLEPGLIKPTGRNNRLLKEDVMKYIVDNNLERKPPKVVCISSKPAKSAAVKTSVENISSKKSKSPAVAASKYKDIQLTNIQQLAAKRLLASKQKIPHSYSMTKCNVDSLLKANEFLFSEGIKVTLNDMLIKATALALQLYPKVNARFINNEIKLSDRVDITVAVSQEVSSYAPVVRCTNLKSVQSISQEISALLVKAKAGQLKSEEFEGGTFTVSNLGMLGIRHYKDIINPPQCGILAIGDISEILNSDLVFQKQMILNLSYDRRAVLEHEAAEFLEALKYLIENPKIITFGVYNSINKEL